MNFKQFKKNFLPYLFSKNEAFTIFNVIYPIIKTSVLSITILLSLRRQ